MPLSVCFEAKGNKIGYFGLRGLYLNVCMRGRKSLNDDGLSLVAYVKSKLPCLITTITVTAHCDIHCMRI